MGIPLSNVLVDDSGVATETESKAKGAEDREPRGGEGVEALQADEDSRSVAHGDSNELEGNFRSGEGIMNSGGSLAGGNGNGGVNGGMDGGGVVV